MNLDKEKVKAMREEFDDYYPNGIKLPNFLLLMKCAIEVAPEDQAELILGIYRLFQEIDINGDEHMEWSEFTQYIIDAVMGQHTKDKKDDREMTAQEIMDMAESHKSRRYAMSSLQDRTVHTGPVRQAFYCPNMDLVCACEDESKGVKLFNLNSDLVATLSPAEEDAKTSILGTNKNIYVLCAGYSEANHMFVVSASNRRLYLFEDSQHNFRFSKSFESEENQYNMWFFEEHQTWITAGKRDHRDTDEVLRQWNMQEGRVLHMYVGHKATIMDAVELKNPQCVASVGMDGRIILWDLEEMKELDRLSHPGVHAKGVRSIDYCPEYGGNIVTVGFEKTIHVWSPEVTLKQCYNGRMEGHNCPVVACKFFKGRPLCVSADELGNVRVWDIRFMSCIQIITQEKGKLEVSKIVILTKQDKFVLAGKRLMWFGLQRQSAVKSLNAELTPIFADFNFYYQQFVVVTKFDVRVYDSVTGRLKKIYTEVLDPKTESELSSFCLDSRHRKFILGDNTGGIRVYNFSNGALIHMVSGFQDELEDLPQRRMLKSESRSRVTEVKYMKTYELMMSRLKGQTRFKEAPEPRESRIPTSESRARVTSNFTSEISGLNFCKDDKLLIACSWDSSIRVYDQSDAEDSPMLRLMTGGHQGADITCLAYSSHFSLFATGASNGIVSLWDFEMGKLEAALFAHRKEVTCIQFLEPHPVVITTANDCVACFWYIRPYPGKMRYQCFFRVVNKSWSIVKDMKTAITSFSAVHETAPEIQRIRRHIHTKVKRAQPIEDQSQKLGLTKNRSTITVVGRSKEIERSTFSKLVSSPGTTTLIEAESEDEDLLEEEFEEFDSEYEWVEEAKEEPVGSCEEGEGPRAYLYVGDTKGYVKIWDLKYIYEEFEVPMIGSSEREKQSYNPRRKDEKNAENDIKFWLKESELHSLPPVKRAEKRLLVKEWKAHNDTIVTLKLINEPKGILTCSTDKSLRIWSRAGLTWGLIHIGSAEPPKKWDFPFDWESKRQRDIAKVMELLTLMNEQIDFDPRTLGQDFPDRHTPKPTVRKPQPKQAPIVKRLARTDDSEANEKIRDMFTKQINLEDDVDREAERKLEFPKSTLRGHALSLAEQLEFYEKNRRRKDDPKARQSDKKKHDSKRLPTEGKRPIPRGMYEEKKEETQESSRLDVPRTQTANIKTSGRGAKLPPATGPSRPQTMLENARTLSRDRTASRPGLGYTTGTGMSRGTNEGLRGQLATSQ